MVRDNESQTLRGSIVTGFRPLVIRSSMKVAKVWISSIRSVPLNKQKSPPVRLHIVLLDQLTSPSTSARLSSKLSECNELMKCISNASKMRRFGPLLKMMMKMMMMITPSEIVICGDWNSGISDPEIKCCVAVTSPPPPPPPTLTATASLAALIFIYSNRS